MAGKPVPATQKWDRHRFRSYTNARRSLPRLATVAFYQDGGGQRLRHPFRIEKKPSPEAPGHRPDDLEQS